MVKANALITDYNNTFVPGYEEIALAYALMSRAVRELRVSKALRLFLYEQPRCWYLTIAHKLDRVGQVFAESVLQGEDPEYIRQVLERPDSFLYRMARESPKIGPKMDTRPIPLAAYVVEQAKKKGKKTGIYSASFQEVIEASLRRYGRLGIFDFIYGNPFIVENGRITGIQTRVDWSDKGIGFENLLESHGLPKDGSGVIFVGDSPPDIGVLKRVEYPVIAPTAKPEFRDRCVNELGSVRVLVPRTWEGIARIFEFD